ncbi:hypothetical protein BaRGS_00012458, partial [Batillaria attramentaria]
MATSAEPKHVDDAYPAFQLGKPRFDQGTFYGRLRHFLDVIDPRTLFTTKAQLEASIKLLEDYKLGSLPPGITDKQLWEAQKIKQAIIHPDTGQKIFMPFRMSGFVPFGTPMVVGMLLPNPTLRQVIFWQWLNQSHNACVNYANRNASKPTPVERFVMGYVGAVTSAVSIAVGLSLLIRRASRFSPTTKMLIQRFVPFPAVATASTCNVVLMRNSELVEGIEVFDRNEKVIGTSKVAARKALEETALTRMTRFLKMYPRMHLPINAVVCTLAFGCALPVAIALFPQISRVGRVPGDWKHVQQGLDRRGRALSRACQSYAVPRAFRVKLRKNCLEAYFWSLVAIMDLKKKRLWRTRETKVQEHSAQASDKLYIAEAADEGSPLVMEPSVLLAEAKSRFEMLYVRHPFSYSQIMSALTQLQNQARPVETDQLQQKQQTKAPPSDGTK